MDNLDNEDVDESISSFEEIEDIISQPRPWESSSFESQSSGVLSQGLSPENCKRFRKYPILNEVFEPLAWNENRLRRVKCKSCCSILPSNRVDRLFKHVDDCGQINDEMKGNMRSIFNVKMQSSSSKDNDRRNLKLAAVIIENNLPIKFVESRSFKEFIKDVAVADYRPALRRDISSSYIPIISNHMESRFISKLSSHDNYFLSVEFDHWTDLIHRSVLGVIATKPDGTRFLFDLEDVSLAGHSSEAIITSLKRCLSRVPPIKINAIISDSASNCKAARFRLALDFEFSHLIEHRCIAHLINLIALEFCSSNDVESVMKSATEIANYLLNDTYFRGRLRQLKIPGVKLACKTRWSSSTRMLESLIRVRDRAIVQLDSANRRDNNKLAHIMDKLNDAQLWEDINSVLKFLKPISECVSVAERSDGSLGEAIKSLLDYASIIFKTDISEPFAASALSSFLTYINKDKLGSYELGLLLAAYALDRRNKMDYITDEGSLMVFKTVVNIAGISSLSARAIEQILYNEFKDYCDQVGPLSRFADSKQTARDWWRNLPNDCSVLKTVGLRLANLRSSSANIERLFSLVKYTQGLNRTNHCMSTLTSLGRAKLSMLQNELDDEVYQTICEGRNPRNPGKDRIDGTDGIDEIVEANRTHSQSMQRDTRSSRKNSKDQPATRCLQQNITNLPAKIISYYEQFKKLIDFDKINTAKECLQVMINDEDELDVDGLLKRFKEDKNLS